MAPEFNTDRLYMRPFTGDDAPFILDLDSDPEVMRFINGGTPSTAAEVAAMTERILKVQKEFSDFGFWSVFSRKSEEFVGWYILRPQVYYQNVIEIGYRLKRKFWGQGLATEGSLKLMKYGFDEIKIPKVLAITDPKHVRSQNVLKKIGLKYIDDRPYVSMLGRATTVSYFEATGEDYRAALKKLQK